MKLFLDDIRQPPLNQNWILITDPQQAIDLIKTNEVSHISFDHDLRQDMTGYDVAKFIEMGAYQGWLKPILWQIHSDNPVGANNIRNAMKMANKFWIEQNYIWIEQDYNDAG